MFFLWWKTNSPLKINVESSKSFQKPPVLKSLKWTSQGKKKTRWSSNGPYRVQGATDRTRWAWTSSPEEPESRSQTCGFWNVLTLWATATGFPLPTADARALEQDVHVQLHRTQRRKRSARPTLAQDWNPIATLCSSRASKTRHFRKRKWVCVTAMGGQAL